MRGFVGRIAHASHNAVWRDLAARLQQRKGV
jgi:hypothetical protein